MAAASEGPADVEGGTPARIRDAAVALFGRDGFGVGLRAIAAAAEVTAGLIVHHFGSKQGLRNACDEHVLAVLREEKTKAMTAGTAGMLMAQLAEVDRFVPIVQYVVRSLQTGGTLAVALMDHMIADAEEYLAAGEAAGVIRPSVDPAKRTRYLAYQAAGGMMLWSTLHGGAANGGGAADFRTTLRQYVEEITPAALELFTQGLFVDRSMLDDFLMYVPDPPSDGDSAP